MKNNRKQPEEPLAHSVVALLRRNYIIPFALLKQDKKPVLRNTTDLTLKVIIHPFAFKSMSLVSIFVVVFAKMKNQENFRALIEREIFHWKPYGFARY